MSAAPAFRLPGWASRPRDPAPTLITYKDADELARTTLDGKAMLFGRKVENAPERGMMRLDHDSISREHAVIVHAFQGESFVCDLDSRFGSKLNGEPLKPRAYTPLAEGAELRFGESSRSYKFYRRPPAAARSSGGKARVVAPSSKPADDAQTVTAKPARESSSDSDNETFPFLNL